MALASGIIVTIIFISSIAGLVAINDIETNTFQNGKISESTGIPHSEDKIIKALNDFDTELVSFFSDLKNDMGL